MFLQMSREIVHIPPRDVKGLRRSESAGDAMTSQSPSDSKFRSQSLGRQQTNLSNNEKTITTILSQPKVEIYYLNVFIVFYDCNYARVSLMKEWKTGTKI